MTSGSQLNADARQFLELVAKAGDKGADRYGIGSLGSATRQEDRARQRCRKLGFVHYQKGRWFITSLGKLAAKQ